MGCDIHAHSEIKINGQWHHMSVLPFRRNYNLFSFMAGVRSDPGSPKPIDEPRGIPADCTEFTQFSHTFLGTDGHSHSWLSAEEVCRVGDFLEKQHEASGSKGFYYCEKDLGYIFGNGWEMFTKYRDDLPAGVEDARIIFWFDN